MKIGIVFAGQGAQYPGMGKDLYDNFDSAKKIFQLAGKEVTEWCFEGTKEMLRQTHITQPCIYTVTMAAYEAFLEAVSAEPKLSRLDIVGYAGFSLGEYAALTAAGVIREISTGMDIVQKRGNFMAEAGMDGTGKAKGAMVAAFGDRDKILKAVEDVKKGRILQGANFNSPVQTVIAGDVAAVDDFVEAARSYKLKAKKLSVSTAFHCEMMAPAADRLYDILKTVDFHEPDKKVYSNITAGDMMEDFKGGDVRTYIAELMARQAKSPVYWQEIIENLIADGARVIIEIGPGKTLSGITKKISSEVMTLHIEDHESLEATVRSLLEAKEQEA